MAQTDSSMYSERGREGGEMLEAGWLFAVSGATEVAIVVSVGRPPGQPGGGSQAEGDVVRGGEGGELTAVIRLDRAPASPPPWPVSAGHVRGGSEHKVVAAGTVSGVGRLQCSSPPQLSLRLLGLFVQIALLLGETFLLPILQLIFQLFSARFLLFFLVRRYSPLFLCIVL